MNLALDSLNVKIYADGADINGIVALAKDPLIKGFTTNPSLMRVAGVTDYAQYAKDLLQAVPTHPISFEVFADDINEMEEQANEIASWGSNVYVKIPVCNTKAQSTAGLISRLSDAGIALNITAILTEGQVREVAEALAIDTPAVVSIFAGRIADTGIDPIPLMKLSKEILANKPKSEILWASTREMLNIFHAEEAGSHIITVPHGILKKRDLIGKNLESYSLETVKMFYKDALASEFKIAITEEV